MYSARNKNWRNLYLVLYMAERDEISTFTHITVKNRFPWGEQIREIKQKKYLTKNETFLFLLQNLCFLSLFLTIECNLRIQLSNSLIFSPSITKFSKNLSDLNRFLQILFWFNWFLINYYLCIPFSSTL